MPEQKHKNATNDSLRPCEVATEDCDQNDCINFTSMEKPHNIQNYVYEDHFSGYV